MEKTGLEKPILEKHGQVGQTDFGHHIGRLIGKKNGQPVTIWSDPRPGGGFKQLCP